MEASKKLLNAMMEIISFDIAHKAVEIIEKYSPIPSYCFDNINLLVNRNSQDKEFLKDLLSGDDNTILLTKALGYSVYLRNILLEDKSLLVWLKNNIYYKVNFDDLKLEINEILREREKTIFLKNLNYLKKREFIRIVLQEILGILEFEETVYQLSLLSDVVVGAVLDFEYRQLVESYGVPSSDFCIISLGKLGGLELNYSSDIDVIFVYGFDGNTTKYIDNSEFFDKLARNIVSDISSSVGGEFLYRVDTRLRPDGEFGALVRSESSYYAYYEERAQTWEKQMLIKARFSAGSHELGDRFISNIKKIVFSTPLSDAEIADILGIKQKIKGAENDLKKSTGGIRDIEFIVQLLQLIFGTKESKLRSTNTLKAIYTLEELKIIDNETRRVLEDGYRNLRRLENYIQLYSNLQDFSIPVGSNDRMIGLYRLLHFSSDRVIGNENTELLKLVNRLKQDVIKVKKYIFEKFLDVRVGEESIFFLYNSDEEEVRKLLANYGLTEVSRAFSFLESMVSKSFRGGVETSIGLRNLLRAVSLSPMPDRSLSNIYYILDATQNLPISIQFFTDERNVRFILNASILKDMFINTLRKRSWIWDGMMDIQAFRDYLLGPFLGRVDFNNPNYRNVIQEVWEVFMTSLALIRVNEIFPHQTIKDYIAKMYDKIFSGFSEVLDGKLCILALGRLASRRINFFSDVDLIYVIPYSSSSDEFYEVRDKTLNIHNNLNLVFNIDTRLVEGSHKGSFILSLDTLRNSQFEIWQTIAYLKSRPISSNPMLSEEVKDIVVAKLKHSIQNLNFKEYDNYVTKVIKAFENTDDIKKGRGNLLEIELVLDKIYFKNYMEFDDIPIGYALPNFVEFIKERLKVDIPISEYIRYLIEIEDYYRIVEGIRLDEDTFNFLRFEISLEDFRKLRSEIIEWCNKVITQE
ncbi:MAG: hypothetical protein N2712_04900 [Brevinematales bacterium]|nr:hypothetical protein [Brevinematales bacterium]